MLKESTIKALEGKGFNRWQKGNMDRLYINATQLGLVCSYYNTGNISAAYFKGDPISNSQGRRYKAAKTFIDIKTEKVYSDIPALEEAAREIFLDVTNVEEEDEDGEYIPSAENGDYSPSTPWNAPGMSVSDFI